MKQDSREQVESLCFGKVERKTTDNFMNRDHFNGSWSSLSRLFQKQMRRLNLGYSKGRPWKASRTVKPFTSHEKGHSAVQVLLGIFLKHFIGIYLGHFLIIFGFIELLQRKGGQIFIV